MDREEDEIKYFFSSLFPEPVHCHRDEGQARWKASQPESPNSETQYSSGEEFNIGFHGQRYGREPSERRQPRHRLNFGYTTSKSRSCTIPDWGVEQRHKGHRTGPDDDDVAIEASWVNPIPIKELKLSPDPANGAKGEKVTGTIVLERAASIPVTVKLFSNNGNAVLGAPLPGVSGGSQSTVTIDQGKSSATFNVNVATNDNRLNKGQHTTATITASYTEATSTQLRIRRP